ncbi:MAG TPA: multiheme c-type cytochrome [Pirellulales bacterium]|nr:multiheme c-type cytochrome [Pirellulales bacterium]
MRTGAPSTPPETVAAAPEAVDPTPQPPAKEAAAIPPADAAPTANATPPAAKPRQDSELFVNWGKPDVVIVATGEQLGYIEPCGCAGLDNQKGGMSRRYTFIDDLRKRGWPVVPVDVGGQVHRFGQQAEIKFQTTVEGLKQMDYAAVGFGPDDLRLPAGVLAASVADTNGGPSRFIDANVDLFAADSALTSRSRIVEAGGRKFGITAAISDNLQKEVDNIEIVMTGTDATLADIVPKLKAQSDYLILLSYAEPEETKRLVKKFPDFQLAVTAHGAAEPPAQPEPIEGTKAVMVEVGHKGMFAVVVGLYANGPVPMRYQRVPLDSRFTDAAAMIALKRTYQQQLETIVTTQGWAALGARPQTYPGVIDPTDPAGKFAGSEACGKCHTKAYAIWKETPHANATATLVGLDPQRQFDPECVSCHTTGWNPQHFYPYLTGYQSMQQTPQLAGNGCENCHGPGAAHAEVETRKVTERFDALRASVRVTETMAKDRICSACHDLDNSPEFDFSTYWPQVEHHGKD